VTPRAQPGNPKPRLFRLPEAEALINRLGFNNDGVEALTENIRRSRYRGILGINVGKNFDRRYKTRNGVDLAQAGDVVVAQPRSAYRNSCRR